MTMTFDELLKKINEYSKNYDFATASLYLEKEILNLSDKSALEQIIRNIGIIPEGIQHNSTEEKLFAKVSDSVLAKAFQMIGLKAIVMTERADAADVLAESKYHNYSLVADAKAFRLSRTAKNQKDFKVVALSEWRQDSDYAVLCSPYYQYATKRSQIYEQALKHDVCLLSWEHILFLIKHDIKESEQLNLSFIWGFSKKHSESDHLKFNERKSNFFKEMNTEIIGLLNFELMDLEKILESQKSTILLRGEKEKRYWEEQINLIKQLTREEAIAQLLKTKKIEEKIEVIDRYMERLK